MKASHAAATTTARNDPMPKRLVAFGNNVCGNLDPTTTAPILATPTDITNSVKCHKVVWTSWNSTIGRDDHDKYWIWGMDPLVTSEERINELVFTHKPKRILGHDRPIGYIAEDHHVYLFDRGERSSHKWEDAQFTGVDKIYALSADRKLQYFANLDDFLSGPSDSTLVISHPMLSSDRSKNHRSVTLHAMESRCFVQIDLSLFEVDVKPTNATSPSLRLIEDLEGLGIQQICKGGRNRLGIVTQAGEAYMIDSKDRTPHLISGEEDEVRLMGLGSDFELLVTENGVLARGFNAFGQLGVEGVERTQLEEFLWVKGLDGSAISEVICSRWSTFLTIDDK